MSNLLDQYEFAIRPVVPEGGIPLSYITVPPITPGTHVKLANLAQSATPGLLKLNDFVSMTYNITNSVVDASVSGTLDANKVPDSSFSTNFTTTPTYWAGASGWVHSTTMGRDIIGGGNYLDYQSGDEPAFDQVNSARPKCAYLSWANDGSLATLQSATFAASGIDEGAYTNDQIAYRLSCWVAFDNIDINGTRQYEGTTVTANETLITINVVSTDGATPVTGSTRVISFYDPTTKSILNGDTPYRMYTKVTTDYFRIPNGHTSLYVEVHAIKGQGLLVDDVIVKSYAYVEGARVTGGHIVPSTNTNIDGNIEPGTESLLNPEFTGDDGTSLCSFTTYGSNELLNAGFESSNNGALTPYWTGTGATAELDTDFAPHEGLKYCVLSAAGQYITQTVATPVHPLSGHTVSVWMARNSTSSAVTGNIKIEGLNTGGSVLCSVSGDVTPTTSWAEYTQALSITGAVTKFRVTITAVDLAGASPKLAVDVVSLHETNRLTQIDNWTAAPRSSRWGGEALDTYFIEYNTFNPNYRKWMIPYYYGRDFGFTQYQAGAPTIIYPRTSRPLLSSRWAADFSKWETVIAHFNTLDIILSDAVSVSTDDWYELRFTPAWTNKEEYSNPKNSFAQPTRIKLTGTPPGVGTLDYNTDYYKPGEYIINEMGYVTIELIGYNGSGDPTILTTRSLKPTTEDLADVVAIQDSTELFAKIGKSLSEGVVKIPAGIVNVRAQITFCATWMGICEVNLIKWVATGSGGSGSLSAVSVYRFTDPISVDGIHEDETGVWSPLIKDGLVAREYTVPTPAPDLIAAMGYAPNDDLVLIYTIPEYNLWPQYDNITHQVQHKNRTVFPTGDNSISLGEKNIARIQALTINGVPIISGAVDLRFDSLVEEYPLIFTSVDAKNGTADLIQTLNEGDDITATFTRYSDRFIYRGYVNQGGSWENLDLNPEWGHDCPINQPISLYAVPTSVYYASSDISGVYNYTSVLSVTGSVRPKSFVRHTQGSVIPDEGILLARLQVMPPAHVEDIEVLPLDVLGGGIPEEWDITSPDFYWVEMVGVPTSGYWYDTGIDLLAGDKLKLDGYGSAPTSGDIHGVLASSLHWYVTTSTPASSVTGATFTSGTSEELVIPTSGRLYLRVIDAAAIGTGELHMRVEARRLAHKMGRWDISTWDGEPILLNGVVVVEIPEGLRDGTGGYRQIPQETIQQVVRDHAPAGVLPLIRYVND